MPVHRFTYPVVPRISDVNTFWEVDARTRFSRGGSKIRLGSNLPRKAHKTGRGPNRRYERK
jgi:hypothetical protein